MWLNVKFYNSQMALIAESAAYDAATGELGHDADAKIYEIKPGLDETVAPLVGVDPGPSFHFVLNNAVFKDNRIPPRGFTNAAFASFGGAHVDYSYADGQYWDETYYAIPEGATSAEVTLYYQSTSKEFIEFLRDHNTTNTKGQELYDLWNDNDKCPPEVMLHDQIELSPTAGCPYTCGDVTGGGGPVDLNDFATFAGCYGLSAPTVDCNGTALACSDLNGDGTVNLADFSTFAVVYGLESTNSIPDCQ
jgi:hypothetical protein